MIRLLYTSRAETAFNESELLTLLSLSQSNNERDGLSGRLVHIYDAHTPDDAWFAQVLEGEEATVDRAMQRIASDELHRDLVVLSRTSITSRMFPAWSMRLDAMSRARAAEIARAGDLESGLRSLPVVERLLYGTEETTRP